MTKRKARQIAYAIAAAVLGETHADEKIAYNTMEWTEDEQARITAELNNIVKRLEFFGRHGVIDEPADA